MVSRKADGDRIDLFLIVNSFKIKWGFVLLEQTEKPISSGGLGNSTRF